MIVRLLSPLGIGQKPPIEEKISSLATHRETANLRNIPEDELARQIEAAAERIAEHVVRTPIIRLPWLDRDGREVWAKLECHQHSGSFKYRGALNALMKTDYQRVITASAGNHALATAAAGKQVGKEVQVVAPTTASELKVNRLLSDASVSLLGSNLHEATIAAMGIAKESGNNPESSLRFLSPYADPDVVAGAGTVIKEALDDAGVDFDTVVVPLGGGGLAAATAAWCAARRPGTQIICTHPEIFGRDFDAGRVSEKLAHPTVPTYSDGLGVQLVEDTPFADIIDRRLRSIIQVSESDTAAAIAYILRLQSLLIEGAAATTIAAWLTNDPIFQQRKGKVLLLLTGANVASSTVAKALVADVHDPKRRQQLGLRHILNPVERHGAVAAGNGRKRPEKGPHLGHHISQSMIDVWSVLFERLQQSTVRLKNRFDEKRQLSNSLGLQTHEWCVTIFIDVYSRLVSLLDECHNALSTGHLSLKAWELEERYRVLLQLRSTLVSLFDRCSAAYDQSRADWFFDPASQNAAAVNYDRYGSPDLRDMERNMLSTIRVSSSRPVELLLASSGMAAYQILQHFLLQHLSVNDTIVLPPYIYFEALEQLQALTHIRVVHAPSFDAEDIIAIAEKHNARAVFADPVANIVSLDCTDLKELAKAVSNRPGWEDRYLVVDGTMASGALEIVDWFQSPSAPTLLYYESVSKYLQLGLDIQMGGLLVYPADLDHEMRTIRRNTGTIMYPRNAALLPPIDFDVFQCRMRLLTENAELLYNLLRRANNSIAEISFPMKWREMGWRHGGSLVTIRFYRDGMNNKEGLEACIDRILRAAENLHVPMVKGVSFGFSFARISSASSMAKDSDPFLRIAVGVESDHIQPLATAIIQGVEAYCLSFNPELFSRLGPTSNGGAVNGFLAK
ncbi:tryptophan synthase beta subunit-like PLP-dependent enzyme [Aspergillus pseudonomiae]|nr:tryptophan synthase beta subunit-like PLP-dependent enzyme [Aspergillus pseudonomiae]